MPRRGTGAEDFPGPWSRPAPDRSNLPQQSDEERQRTREAAAWVWEHRALWRRTFLAWKRGA